MRKFLFVFQVFAFEVRKVSQEEIVDVNGAGDAFVCVFMSQLAQGKDLKNNWKFSFFCHKGDSLT